MTFQSRSACCAAFALSVLLSGCSLLPSTRKLPVPKAPPVVQSVTPQQLVEKLNQRWNELQTLNATVEIQFTLLQTSQGISRTEPTFRGHILMRKPQSLRVLGQVPVLGTTMFDMAGNGQTFTLLIPSREEAIQGSYTVHKKSANKLENIRPSIFFDAMVVRGIDPSEYYSVIADSETVEDPAHKHLLITPEYVLSITRHNPDSHADTEVRDITFHRQDLLPYQQNIYDAEGNLETQVEYANYHTYEGGLYPSTISIRRPMDDLVIVLTVEKVTENMALPDDQFQIKIPAGTTVKNLQ